MVHYWQFHIAQLLWIWIMKSLSYTHNVLSFYSSFAAKNICNSGNKVTHFFTFSVNTKTYIAAQRWCHCEKAEFVMLSTFVLFKIFSSADVLKQPGQLLNSQILSQHMNTELEAKICLWIWNLVAENLLWSVI